MATGNVNCKGSFKLVTVPLWRSCRTIDGGTLETTSPCPYCNISVGIIDQNGRFGKLAEHSAPVRKGKR